MAACDTVNIDVPELIVQVKNRPPLYDTTLPEYHDRNLKRRLWLEVCCDIFSPAVWNGLTAKEQAEIGIEIQNRWNSLRGCFRRDLNAQKSPPSGIGGKKKRKYIYFDALLFLLPFTEVTNGKSTAEFKQDENSSEENNASEQTLQKKTKLKVKKKNYDNEMRKILKEKMNKKNEPAVLEMNSVNDENDDEAFFRSLLPCVMDFTPDQKLMLRIEIMKTILTFKQSQVNSAKPLETPSTVISP